VFTQSMLNLVCDPICKPSNENEDEDKFWLPISFQFYSSEHASPVMQCRT
jgi:hypothetical protein